MIVDIQILIQEATAAHLLGHKIVMNHREIIQLTVGCGLHSPTQLALTKTAKNLPLKTNLW